MKTIFEVEQWCQEAAEFGDPADAVCQLFVRYVDADRRPKSIDGYLELFCFWERNDLVLWLGPDLVVPIGVSGKEPEMGKEGDLLSFGAERISPGVWELKPSLNIPGLLHGFVVLYDVPTPAPWEQLIVLAS